MTHVTWHFPLRFTCPCCMHTTLVYNSSFFRSPVLLLNFLLYYSFLIPSLLLHTSSISTFAFLPQALLTSFPLMAQHMDLCTIRQVLQLSCKHYLDFYRNIIIVVKSLDTRANKSFTYSDIRIIHRNYISSCGARIRVLGQYCGRCIVQGLFTFNLSVYFICTGFCGG